jgi:teichuronic acid exporter
LQKQKAITSLFWSTVEKFSAKGVQFLLGIVLARLLLPEDYGLIGIVLIFFAISNTITDSGFKSALIQKKNRDEKDFSTVFFFNIVVAILFYIILFFAAPLISIFFDNEALTLLIRVSMISIIINSFSVVQIAKFSIDLDFKTQTKATLISILISGSVGIAMAYYGYGVWALVTQFIIRNLVNVVLLWLYSSWIPLDGFHKDRFKSLFSFGYKLLISSLLDTIYRNIYLIIIGKFFTIRELGFYTRAKQFSDFPSSNLTQILDRVTFPLLSQIQDDKQKLTEKYKLLIGNTSLVFFPLMILLLTLAEPIIILVLTEKWLSVVWMLQLLCIASIWYPIHALNLNILKVIGRSDLFLKLEVYKKIITTIILIISLPFGIKGLIIGMIIASLIALFLNTSYTQKFINYSLIHQFKDISIVLFFNVLMGLIVFYITSLIDNDLMKIIAASSVGILFYVSVTWIFNVGHIRTIPNYFKK